MDAPAARTLTYQQRQQLRAARLAGRPDPVFHTTDAASVASIAQRAVRSPLVIALRFDLLLAFVRLAAKEARPVEDVLAEYLGDCAKLIKDADLFEEEETPASMPPRLANAMLLAARAADERERFVPEDREEWSRPMLFGHLEVELAHDA